MRTLQDGERLLAEGKSPGEVRQVLEVGEAERLKELESENAWPKRIMAPNDLEIDKLMEIATGNQRALPDSGPRPPTRQTLPSL